MRNWNNAVGERTNQLAAVDNKLTKEVLQRERAEKALLRSEAYLAEAQRVSHTGSFGWSVSSGDIVWSEETFRILGFDPTRKPTVEVILERTHPEDRALVQETLHQATEKKRPFDVEHRLLMPDGSVKCIRVVGHPSTHEDSGDVAARTRAVPGIARIRFCSARCLCSDLSKPFCQLSLIESSPPLNSLWEEIQGSASKCRN